MDLPSQFERMGRNLILKSCNVGEGGYMGCMVNYRSLTHQITKHVLLVCHGPVTVHLDGGMAATALHHAVRVPLP